jgi:hypothetical protein
LKLEHWFTIIISVKLNELVLLACFPASRRWVGKAPTLWCLTLSQSHPPTS